MKIKSITIFSVFLLLFSFATTATACPPPDCGDCETWNGEECVPYGDCWGGCPSCESCVGCYCQCTSECGCDGKTCSGCKSCVDCACEDDQSKCTAECDKCLNGSCVDDQSQCFFCDSCVSGSCISTCTACQKCVDGGGYICVNDCPDCKDCVSSSCEGGCDVCYYCNEWSPGFYECDYDCDVDEVCCDTGCTPECSRSDPTGDCNDSQNSPCPNCVGLLDSCSSYSTTVYSDNLIYTCSGGCPGDCEYDDVYCSTEYYCDTFPMLFYSCETWQGEKTCVPTGPGSCDSCYQDIDVKQVNNVSSGSCN